MPISDTDMMVAHLTGLSDEELSSGSKLLTELKNLLIREQRLRAVIPLKEHNEKWMEQFGEYLAQLESAVKEHKAMRNGSFFEDLDYRRDEYGDLEVEVDDDIREVRDDLKEQWKKNHGYGCMVVNQRQNVRHRLLHGVWCQEGQGNRR